MKCPACGAKMKDGQMYCEACGCEIQIVPEFEPEIENSILETLSDVASEIGTNIQNMSTETELFTGKEDNKEDNPKSRRKTKKTAGIYIAVSSVVLFAVCIAVLYWFWSNQPEKIYQKAVSYMEKEAYTQALAAFENAAAKDEDNVLYLNSLADCYMLIGDEKQAEETSRYILTLDESDLKTYSRLIRILKNRQEYEQINTLLQNCKSTEITMQYMDFMANPPAFDLKGDTYREKIDVKLIANASGTLYYTLDGSVPTLSSEVYTTPIPMESGQYTVKALFVNQYGVQSQVAVEKYYIDVSRPEAPVVSPASGEYKKPGYISVEIPENCKVYFTADGTVPDNTSSRYEAPFPMPAGNSTFQFIVYDEGGVSGELTKCQYNLNLNASLSMEAAANQLLLKLKETGILLNLNGDVAGKAGRNKYIYKYAVTIEKNDYYLYREYYEESTGNSYVTGTDYVVNYMTGECFKAVRSEDGSYSLYTIENNGQSGMVQQSRT